MQKQNMMLEQTETEDTSKLDQCILLLNLMYVILKSTCMIIQSASPLLQPISIL